MSLAQILFMSKKQRMDQLTATRFLTVFLPQLCDTVPKEVVEAEMTGALVKFLKDTEPEVRTAAAFKVTGKLKSTCTLFLCWVCIFFENCANIVCP
jgi:hypothetical protein